MVNTVIVKKTVVKKTSEEVQVYLDDDGEFITLMIGDMSAININKESLQIVINDSEYAVRVDYGYPSDFIFSNITKW